jgi:hypothetical protein
MALPQVEVGVIDAPPAQSVPLDGTTAFVAGPTERGTLGAHLVTSMRDWARPLGARTGEAIPTWDAVDVLLREGVSRVYVSREVGTTPVTASANLAGATGTSVVLKASSPGAWINGWTWEVTAPSAGTRQVSIRDADGNLQAQSLEVATRDELVDFADGNHLVDMTLGADPTLPVAAGPTAFAGGDADLDTISAATLRAALDRMPKGLGTGQVLAPWRTSLASHTEVLEHAAATWRTAYLDAPLGSARATLESLLVALRALGTGAEGVTRKGGIWGQYATGPGVVPATTRTVPWSVVQAGLTARAERQEGHPNVAPAGPLGVPRWARGVDRYWDETPAGDAEVLFDAGMNVVVKRFGSPRAYSFRSLDDPATSQWVDLAHDRTANFIQASSDSIGEQLSHRTVDAGGIAAGEFGGKIRDMLGELWRAGGLYGLTLDEAALVDTGPLVNTTDVIVAREIRAALGVVFSEHAERVLIEVAKVPIRQEVA